MVVWKESERNGVELDVCEGLVSCASVRDVWYLMFVLSVWCFYWSVSVKVLPNLRLTC